MIELAVLGLLKEQPMHGYQLSQEMADQQGGLFRVSFGSLYPTLRRLEGDGAIERAASDRTTGRRKTVYRITPEGERLFLQWLEEPQDDQAEDTRFGMRVAFFRYLPPERRIRLLERRRQRLEQRLEEVKAHLRDPGSDDDYQRALVEHQRGAIEADIAWLTGLIHRERTTYGLTAPVGDRRRASATLRRKEHPA